MGRMTWLRELVLFDNYINLLPVEFGYLYQLELFIVDGNPLIEPLFSINQSQGGLAVILFLRDNNTMTAAPTDRPWLSLAPANGDSQGDLFSLLSYNILSERYATPRQYGYVPSWALEWSYRRELILNEILNLSADFVCVQEIDTCSFEDYFRPQLGEKYGGYLGTFLPKSRSKTMTEKERKTVDGCATFYKASRYKLEESWGLEFSQLASQKPEITKIEASFQRLILRDNISLVSRFVDLKTPSRQFIVANVHIHWNPEFKDVKLIQTILLMEELDKIMARYPQAQLVIAGDFNSLPDSGVYRFLSDGKVNSDDPDFIDFKYGKYTQTGAQHAQSLRSVYTTASAPEASKMITSYTPWFIGQIDYIWYSTQSSLTAVPSSLLGPTPDEYTSKVVGFPSQHYPSDHVSIMAEFKITGGPAGNVSRHQQQFYPTRLHQAYSVKGGSSKRF